MLNLLRFHARTHNHGCVCVIPVFMYCMLKQLIPCKPTPVHAHTSCLYSDVPMYIACTRAIHPWTNFVACVYVDKYSMLRYGTVGRERPDLLYCGQLLSPPQEFLGLEILPPI